jgi:4-carboxymuconolactone decarboxylase
MSRLAPLTESDLNDEQRAVLDAIQSGPRGRLGLVGPFGVFVRAPKIGMATQALGAAVRYETSLPERIKEIAICTVGAHFQAKFEFAAHGPMAIRAGVSETAVEAIRQGETPSFDEPADVVSYRVASQLLGKHRIDDATYAEATDAFGETGLIELVSVIGYYCQISLTLNAFEIPLTASMSDPFPES